MSDPSLKPLEPPLIVLVGETASGKSALAMHLAEKFNGEIIAADSRTIYKGMDIGTAKPSAEDQAKIRHHLIDVTTPDKPITVADFKELTLQAINDISGRGKLPILVGGTGLYIDAVIFDFHFRPLADPKQREYLSGLTVQQLQSILQQKNLPLPNNSENPRHLIRSIETDGEIPTKEALRQNTLVIGLLIDRSVLQQRIAKRIEGMVEAGLIQEIQSLADYYGWNTSALQAPAYRAFRSYLNGDISLEEAKAQFLRNDLDLAKRQRVWFKRNNSIHWLAQQIEAVDLVTTHLNKQNS